MQVLVVGAARLHAPVRLFKGPARGGDVFCHMRKLREAGIDDVEVGDRLLFTVVQSSRYPDKTEAADVRRLERIARIDTGLVSHTSKPPVRACLFFCTAQAVVFSAIAVSGGVPEEGGEASVSLAMLAEKRGPSAIATLFPRPTNQLQCLCSLGRVRFRGSSSPPLPVRGTDPQQESSRGA
jgi:cold shock CspA family protein